MPAIIEISKIGNSRPPLVGAYYDNHVLKHYFNNISLKGTKVMELLKIIYLLIFCQKSNMTIKITTHLDNLIITNIK